jgi:hypothetical protein
LGGDVNSWITKVLVWTAESVLAAGIILGIASFVLDNLTLGWLSLSIGVSYGMPGLLLYRYARVDRPALERQGVEADRHS